MDGDQTRSPASDCSDDNSVWAIAEKVAGNIISKVQATAISEERRKDVVDYIQRLISNSTCCQVFPFGSVPLKTYLPDGDIDLTAVTLMNVNEEAVANEVFVALEREDQNNVSGFSVKDVQIIHAEVKLVKCLVDNIVIDISFNQLGGLSSLCFLEKVSCTIGKENLFKRSIILIKAWCYYESRVLGAHHALISTYALETLVLYVFNRFYSSLNGPLAVLHKFLQHFSKFDWDNYCVTMNGPVKIAALPEFVVEKCESDMFLSEDFFKECVENYSVSPANANPRTFPRKHLNIVDPLKESNNLGRSVSKGNSYRIRSALSYGARKLGRILSLPKESMSEELVKFFHNTLDRHGTGQRPDVHGAGSGSSSRVPFSNGSNHRENEVESLADLGGELDSHVSNLHYGRYLCECSATSLSSVPPYLSHVFRNSYVNPPLHIGSAFGVDEMPKQRGTGAYFTNLSYYNDRPPTPKGTPVSPKGRPGSFVRSPCSNGRSHKFEKSVSSASAPAHGIEFGSFKSLSINDDGSVNSHDMSSVETSKSRGELQFYELKDEGDFPPLSDKKR